MSRRTIGLLFVLATLAVVIPVTASGLLTASTADDETPGIALPSSPATGTAHYVTDLDDVYYVDLASGQWLYARMTGASGTDFDLHLFGPNTRSVSGTQAAVAFSENSGTSTERILYKAKTAGRHYLDVWAFDGKGSFEIMWGKPSNQASLESSATTTCAWGASPTVSGRLVDSRGAGLKGKTIYVYGKPASSGSYAKVADASTSTSGTFSVTVKPARKMTYRLDFFGSPTYLADSDTRSVSPYAYLTRPVAPSSTAPNRSFTSWGYLKPRHTAGQKSVRLTCSRKESGVWVVRKTVDATNKDYETYTKYSGSVTLPYKGSWKIVASVEGDSTHLRTLSNTRYVTVQ